jgi:amidohydrolase
VKDSKYYKDKVIEEIERVKDRMIEVSKAVHSFAEIGTKEFKSSKLLADELEKNGFKVEREVAGMKTAFKAISHGNPGPTVAFLAEYDALPKLGHACGHNIIGTSAVFAGIAVSKIIKELNGNIAVIGTPDEEGTGGKIKMLQAGAFPGVDIAIMNHPLDRNCAWWPTVALCDLRIVFRGKGAHYATPHKGTNALDAAIATLSTLNIMRHGFRPDVIFGYIIEEGGLLTVTVPERAKLKISVKALDTNYLTDVVDRIKRCARGIANAIGVKVEIHQNPFFEESIPNLTLIQAVKNNFEILGIECEDPLETARHRSFYSTDFGNVSRKLPAVSFGISIGRNLTLHTPEFAKAAISDEGNHALLIATKVMAMTAIDFLTNPEMVRKAKEEFERYKSSNFTNLPLLPLY